MKSQGLWSRRAFFEQGGLLNWNVQLAPVRQNPPSGQVSFPLAKQTSDEVGKLPSQNQLSQSRNELQPGIILRKDHGLELPKSVRKVSLAWLAYIR